MYNDTQQKIFELIHKNSGITVGEIIRLLNKNAAGIFRHLKKLQQDGRIYKIGKTPQVRYYAYTKNMDNKSKLANAALNWAMSGESHWATAEQLCATRDVFQARTDRLLTDLKKIIKDENIVYLLVAVVGEIGNNSFDHNLGQWRDIPGIFFSLDVSGRTVILADRGRGVLSTIKRVRPKVDSDAQALQVAFTEIISGRAPEKRGNGLKFVKKVVEENKFYLEFYSGAAVAKISGNGLVIEKSTIDVPGTFTYITF